MSLTQFGIIVAAIAALVGIIAQLTNMWTGTRLAKVVAFCQQEEGAGSEVSNPSTEITKHRRQMLEDVRNEASAMLMAGEQAPLKNVVTPLIFGILTLPVTTASIKVLCCDMKSIQAWVVAVISSMLFIVSLFATLDGQVKRIQIIQEYKSGVASTKTRFSRKDICAALFILFGALLTMISFGWWIANMPVTDLETWQAVILGKILPLAALIPFYVGIVTWPSMLSATKTKLNIPNDTATEE